MPALSVLDARLLLTLIGVVGLVLLRLFGRWLIRRGTRMRGHLDAKVVREASARRPWEKTPNPFGEE